MPDLRSSSMVPYGYQWTSCGYCGVRRSAENEKTAPKFYAQSEKMSPEDYQTLADRGWRRSGRTYYRPDVRNSCCPHYTIRLDANKFKSSSNQRKAVNAFNKYILGVEYKSKVARLCPLTREEKRRRKQIFDVTQKACEAEYDTLSRPADSKGKGERAEPAHRLTIALEPDNFTKEKYLLYRNYQKHVHKDPESKITEHSFRTFLCAGLPRRTTDDGKRLGSYHQCYRIDGELIAFGVLDLLPHAVSSVYVVYRDDVAHWQFGKLSALREIALTLEGGYEWYYMGYYIHNCAKMRYKAEYRPQYVLDTARMRWHPFDQTFRDALDQGKLVIYNEKELKWTVQPSSDIDGYEGQLPATIWDADFVGVLSPESIVEQLPLREVSCKMHTFTARLEDVVGPWDIRNVKRGRGLQPVIAELIACIGTDLAREIYVDIGPYVANV